MSNAKRRHRRRRRAYLAAVNEKDRLGPVDALRDRPDWCDIFVGFFRRHGRLLSSLARM